MRHSRNRDTNTEPTSYGLRNFALLLSEYLIRFMALDEKHNIKYVLYAQERRRPKFHRQPKATGYSYCIWNVRTNTECKLSKLLII